MTRNLVLAVLAAGLLAGCSGPNLLGEPPGEAQIVSKPWVPRELALPQPQLYCYETLADPVCSPEPIPGRQPIADIGAPIQ